MVTTTQGQGQPEEAGMTEEESCNMMRSCNEPGVVMSFVKGGSTENPSWILLKNGELFATIAYSDQNTAGEDFQAMFEEEAFPARLRAFAASNGWQATLPLTKAKLITSKGFAFAQTPVDREALKASVREDLFNDMQIAYTAMVAGMKANPLYDKLMDATTRAGVPSPEIFVAGVLADPKGEFISHLFNLTATVNKMSDPVKAEYKAFVARQASSTTPVAPPAYTPDSSLSAILASNSVAIAPVTPVEAPAARTAGRFSGILG
jgi:hypothetical protein